mmetsp:Transcript_26367/g.26614  ORF Transcript_26367/g.26614 Transcript_26367/m.26614 type:complete len:159 (+) Transcript_26367:97-573(+)
MLSYLLVFIQENMFISAVVVFFVARWAMSRNQLPIPEVEGSRVVKITNRNDMIEIFSKAKENNQVIVCDFFANWCPPCRVAAPEFAKMSIEYENIIFAKIDVDEARSVSSQYGVRSLPTFKIFINESEVASLTGWRPAELKSLLIQHQSKSLSNKRAN